MTVYVVVAGGHFLGVYSDKREADRRMNLALMNGTLFASVTEHEV
ncbi:hypothetical protein D305_gp42 [Pseudomonas phage UFV-P2]|uniref:Uncharacterized protein n=1 Tax=Pseudomonas phage UFV-P2 TaxID=1235661 RepID=M4T229_9CAUD|nr:hypothetical protein D305_gp42 [Pseudomonas phage UFV-P2]AGH62726.1 hypothetical protein [Pseudomonas phage UFV-P2]